MITYLLILVAAVFLGSELLAIPTPLAQVTIYRLMVLGLFPLTAYHLAIDNQSLKIDRSSVASFALLVFSFWWVWGFASMAWAINFKAWLQTIFLLTLGVTVIWALYLYVNQLADWHRLLEAAWWMMTFLMVWGYFEIVTNHYFLADLHKLDKYGTFSSQPLTRMPITTFENQNDYAVLLLAYLPVTISWSRLRQGGWIRLVAWMTSFLTVYLIYRTQSRMVTLSAFLFLLIYMLLQWQWDVSLKMVLSWLGRGLALMIGMIILVPALRQKIASLVYLGGVYDMSGDEVRLNLWRNGLLFLGQTFGLGVGAGNIETWMAEFGFLDTEVIVNMHNWWLEILVAYGAIVFIAYVLMYSLLIYKLWKLRWKVSDPLRAVNNSFVAFLIAFIFASITSANNMLIEWHWLIFALIISYLKLIEMQNQRPIQTFKPKKVSEYE